MARTPSATQPPVIETSDLGKESAMNDNPIANWANIFTHVLAKGMGVAEEDASDLGHLAEATVRVFEGRGED
jgi:hypothetical protein